MHIELRNIFNSVPYGRSARMDCPVCSKKNTFSVSNLGSSIKYHCFSNSCDSKLSSGVVANVPTHSEMVQILNKRHLTEEFRDFSFAPYIQLGMASKNAFKWVLDHNGLDSYNKASYRCAYDPMEDRLLYLLIDNAKIAGAVGRSLSGIKPKVKIYQGSRVMPFICGNSKTAVIVEDCSSAASINYSGAYTGIALLGTYFKIEYMPYIEDYDKLIIALDPDARKKALELKNTLSYLCDDVTIWNIPKDLKNMTQKEIEDFINYV